jgi:hypothetical protein
MELLNDDDDNNNNHHHPAVRELGNLLARSGLIDPGVHSKVLSGSFNHVACKFF